MEIQLIVFLLLSFLDQHMQRKEPQPSSAAEVTTLEARNRQKRRVNGSRQDRECRLKSLLLPVKDLGLGYESEESILFKFCGGTCPRARTNHDLTLSVLLQKNDIPAIIEDKIFSDPCCRPLHYEDVVFLDDNHQWRTVEKLSASACGCVG